jgi:branched-chain amino acid transport system ATP-binding protein
MTAPALALENVSAGYERNSVLRDLSLSIPRSSVTAVLGPNGAGKTTLLRVISGILPATSGRILLEGKDISRLPAHRRTALGLCHVPEGRGVFRSLTVRENLRMQAVRGEEREALERAVTVFPILGRRLNQTVRTMSGGEQQMLAMARAYIRHPSVVLVDEASLGLAPRVVDSIFEFLRGLADQGATLIIVDQFVTRVLELADHVYLLSRGEITFTGTPEDLRGQDLFHNYLFGTLSGEAGDGTPNRTPSSA